MKHRTKEEITALILEAVLNTNRATQTVIMYKAYLTYAQLKQFLSSLLEKGLIEYQKEDRLYTITEKGIHFLQVYNQLSNLQKKVNVLNTTSEFQNTKPLQVADKHEIVQSSYLTIYDEQRARTNHRWKCEKCPAMFANYKELKLHKVEYHSY